MRLRNFFSGRFSVLLSLAAGITASTSLLQANPRGPAVTNGTITITGGPGVTTINQTSARGIIHWQDFSIGAGELTQFIHLDAKSATLNRVVGGIPTTIQGTLQANGQVYIVNPNGILVGPAGRINTAAFVASTLDVADAQFLAGGDMRFSGNSPQGLVNLGSITATDGDVILMARNVVNAGSINAPNGVAGLAAGNDILLQAAGDERIVINSGIVAGGTGVDNSGSIKAAQAELKAAGGNVYALAVNNTGVVRATGIAKKNGRVILSSNGGVVQNSGQLIAKNADGSGGSVKLDSGKGGSTANSGSINASADDATKNGGTVELLGDTVTVGGSSLINVSGLNAGTVAIGVSSMIANQTTASGGIADLTAVPAIPGAPPISTALQTTIQKNSRIMANSTGAGNGGRIVVWSEKQSVVGGEIEAKGGDLGGNGGLVETSGRTGLTIVPGTKVNTAAPKGKSGTWLLDPAGITVDNNTTDTTGFTQNANTNHVKGSDVVAALAGGTNVSIVTTNTFPATNRDIVVDTALTLLAANPAVTLNLTSAGGIQINQNIGGAGAPLTLEMNAQNGNILFNGGTVQALFVDLRTNGKISSSAAGTVITSTKLMMQTGPQGIGSASQAFGTSVSNLEALLGYVAASPVAGGVFINNTGVTTLNIGGVSSGLSGVQVPVDAAYNEISITTSGALMIGDAGGDRVTGPKDISLTSAGDLKVFNNSANAVRSHFGAVTLSSGAAMEIGEFFSGRTGTVRGGTGVNLLPGGSLVIRAGSVVQADGSGEVFIMGGDQVSVFGGAIQTNGGDVNIFTGPNTLFSTSGSVGVKTTLNPAHHGKIVISADNIDLQGPLNAGNSTVDIKPVLASRSVDLGTETAGKISLTDAELSRITANQLNVIAGTTSGDITVTAPLTHPVTNGMGLFTAAGRVDINAALNRGTGSVGIFAKNGIGGSGQLNASEVYLDANATDINYAGKIITSNISFLTTGNVSLQNPLNDIVTIGTSSGGNGFGGIAITDGVDNLTIDGTVESTGYFLGITAAGSLYINPGATLNSQGVIQLDLSSGNLVNSGGASAIIVPFGGRYVVYERDPFGAHNKGGLTAPDYSPAVSYTDPINDPFSPDSVFYYTNLTPPPQSPPNGFVLKTPKTNYKTITPPDPFAAVNRLAANTFKRINAEIERINRMVAELGEDWQGLSSGYLDGLLAIMKDYNDMAASGSYSAEALKMMLEENVERQIKRAAEFSLEMKRALPALKEAKLNLISRILSPTIMNGAIQDALMGIKVAGGLLGDTKVIIPGAVDLTQLSLSQINQLDRSNILRVLSINGAGRQLNDVDRYEARAGTMTQNQFANIIQASNGQLSGAQFRALIALGAGNLTLNQMAEAGLVDPASLNFTVKDKEGNIISQNGSMLKFNELAKLIGNDGSTLIGNDGSTLIGNDGSTLIGNDGSTLIGNDGSTLIGNDGSTLIGNDGSTLIRNIAALIGNDGSTLIGNDGSTLIGNDGSTLIGNDGGTLINNPAAGLMNGAGFANPAVNNQ